MHFDNLWIQRNALHRSSACQITVQRLAQDDPLSPGPYVLRYLLNYIIASDKHQIF